MPDADRGVDGAEVTTLEGRPTVSTWRPSSRRSTHYASQCGFCSPGMMMAATALLAHTPDASREQIMEALEGHLCRCTGYVKILDAVESVAARLDRSSA